MVLQLLMVFVFQSCVVVAARTECPSRSRQWANVEADLKRLRPSGSVREKNSKVSPSIV